MIRATDVPPRWIAYARWFGFAAIVMVLGALAGAVLDFAIAGVFGA